MAWDRGSRSSASSSRGRGTTVINALESTSPLQPWACSSLSSSEKFLSLYEKMQEDRERKNFESLVCTPCLQQQVLPQEEQQQFPLLLPPTMMMIDKPGSKIVFPHITSRGSLVGKKVYCRTSIHSSVTWRQKSRTQRMRTSLMILNFYQDRSGNSNSLLLGGKQRQTQSSPYATPADSVTSQKKPDHSLDKEQCRGLFLSLAGAAGMRLICPPLQLPLLEILLFFRQQLSNNRADLSEGGGQGLWRFPVNLAIATLRPFCGSLGSRCLTALLCLAQMRIKKNNNCITTTEQENPIRYMSVPADLYSVVIEKEYNGLDRKEFTTKCSTNHFQIDYPVVATTDADGDVAAADKAGRNNNNHGITRLSNIVIGRKFEEECWSSNGLEVVEILFSESEDSLSDREDRLSEDNVPNFLAKDQNSIGSESGCSEDSEFSLVDLEEKDLSPKPLLTQKESDELSSESGLGVTSGNGLHIAVEEARKESFAQSSVAFSCLALQFPSEVITVVKAAADWPGTVCALEDSEGVVAEVSIPLTDGLCLAEEEQAECASVSQPTRSPKPSELANDDEPCSPPRECNEAAVVVESLVSIPQGLAAETVEFQNHLGNEFHDGKFIHFVEGESTERLVEQEFDVYRIEEHRIEGKNCVSSEGLQFQVEVSLPERTSAENEPEKESYDDLELEKANVALESLPLALGETAENQTIEEVQEVKSELCVVEEESVDRVLDCFIDEHRIGGSNCVSPDRLPDLIELLMEAHWIGARQEFAKAAVIVPVEKPSPALTDLAEDQAVNNLQEGKSTSSVEEKSAVKALNQGLEVCAIEIQTVEEIPKVKSEHCSAEKLEDKEHRIDGDDCDDWLESLLEQVEAFISERADILSEHEKAAVTEVVENQAVKDIQEVNFTHPVEGKSPESVLDQERQVCPIEEYRIDNRNCAPSERLQGYTEGFLSRTTSSESGLDDKESLTAGAVTESTEKEVIKEIQEVNTTHLIEEKPAYGVLSQDLDVRPITKDRDREFLERLQRECNAFFSDSTSAENDLEKGLHSGGAVALSVEIPSHALTEFLEGQPIKEIQEVKSPHFEAEKSAERVVNQKLTVSSIEGHGIEDRNCELSERWHVQVDDSLPERTIAENEAEKESSHNLRGRNLEVDFDGDADVPLQKEITCPNSTSSSSSHESNTGQEHHRRPSSTAMADDDLSKDTFSSNYSGATSRESCLEHSESKLISWTGESSSEPSTQTSLTSRLNTATEADNKALDPDTGAIAVVLDDELNRDEKDGHIETKTKVLDEIKSCSIKADDDSQLPDQLCAEAEEIGVNGENNCFPEKCSESSQLLDNLSTESCGVPQGYPEHPFADHPTCIELREGRHSNGDQIYLDMQELLPAPWGQLIFWHGRCKEGRPTLCVLLGKAVRQLPGHELKNFIEVTVSHLEYAELNFFKGNVKQMNILMDLDGLGFMRLPPMHILSAIGAVLNRDYAGRGGWIILVNAPLMLGFVISAIQGVILRPANNKGAAIDSSFKGFLEGKERIIMMGGKYRTALQKHFDCSMLPVSLGGDCPCGSDEEPCRLGNEFLKLQWDTNSHT